MDTMNVTTLGRKTIYQCVLTPGEVDALFKGGPNKPYRITGEGWWDLTQEDVDFLYDLVAQLDRAPPSEGEG